MTNRPGAQAQLRHRNLALVTRALADGPAGELPTRAAIATAVGLTRATVSTLVDELLAAGLVEEAGARRGGTVGRPGTALTLSATGPAGLGAEVGVDHLAACVVNLRGEVLCRAQVAAPNRGRPAADVLAELAELTARVTTEAARLGLDPVGTTVAVPGLVGHDRSTVLRAPNLGWEDIDVPRAMSNPVGRGGVTGAGRPGPGDPNANVTRRGAHSTDAPSAGASTAAPDNDGPRGGGAPSPAVPGAGTPGTAGPDNADPSANPPRGGTSSTAGPGTGAPGATSPGKDVPGTNARRGTAPAPGGGGPTPHRPLVVENEANLGALAELWLGGHSGLADFVHVSAEIGIGAALIVEGRLFRGARGFAGELGHVPVRPYGPVCSCGARGCLETFAGEQALLRAAGLDSARALRSAAAEGETAAVRALEQAGEALGIALSGAVNLLDPQAVVVGGPLAELAPWLLPGVRRELADRVTDRRWRPQDVVTARLGRDGVLRGAAYSAVRTVIDDPGAWIRTTAAG